MNKQTDITVILADGRFPSTSIPIKILNDAKRIICCDGAIGNLLHYGFEPSAIVGDMDSIEPELRKEYSSIIHASEDQYSNDLTKAVNYCVDQGYMDVIILGGTGLREDHALGNISLLVSYSEKLKVIMVTNHGVFRVIQGNTELSSFPRQQVSVFTLDPSVKVSTQNLLYPLDEVTLDAWWKGTLNQSEGDTIKFTMSDVDRLIVFQTHLPK